MQTKLTKLQKEVLPDLMADYNDVQVVDNSFNMTIAFWRGPNTTNFSIAVKSPTEKKFRRKVGKYLAITRLVWDDKFTTMPNDVFDDFLEHNDFY